MVLPFCSGDFPCLPGSSGASLREVRHAREVPFAVLPLLFAVHQLIAVLSGYPTIVAFGLLNLVGLTVVAIVYTEAFVSLWCVYAACTSLLVLLHMVGRRRLPDPHRLRGEPLVSV